MKLAISNLAWAADEDGAVVEILNALKVRGVELAPTKNWPLLETVTESDATIVRRQWESRGLEICALQSLLFGKTHLQLFQGDGIRQETITFIKKVIDIAYWLGARALVFGSPKNRIRGGRSFAEATEIAVPFFRELGDYAAEKNCSFCIEPNPPIYGCDFIVNSTEGFNLVTAVNSPGFGLHLDSAGMFLIGEHSVEAIETCAPLIKHFHLSAPQLDPVNDISPINYQILNQTLDAVGYSGWRSIEMKPAGEGNNIPAVAKALEYITECTPR